MIYDQDLLYVDDKNDEDLLYVDDKMKDERFMIKIYCMLMIR
jgi:hypothetical protein